MKGIGASPGYAIGPVLIKKDFVEPVANVVEDTQLALNQLTQSLSKSEDQIKTIMAYTIETMGVSEGDIFQAHLMMLNDPELINQIKQKINNNHFTPEYATLCVRNDFMAIFDAMDNDYMKERKADVKDVCNRIIKNIMGVIDLDFAAIDVPVILVAHDLTPSDTASMSKDKIAGFITEIGGKTSHTAIMSRTLEIPAIVGADNIIGQLNTSDTIAFNGETGEIFINPEEELINDYVMLMAISANEKESLKAYVGKKTNTLDGHHVEIGCNIGQPKDVYSVIENDGEGIGLFRSEFLYMDRDELPTEEEQFQAYKTVLENMNGKPVVIRTLDVGGDKQLSYLDFPKEENPFLGFRAIRYCLENEKVFKDQLSALVRASVYGNLKIMFPMISNVREIRAAKQMLLEVKESLAEKNIPYGDFEVGIMIEIPAAAIISDQLAKEVDFFSIGTNDLIQYTVAVDRMNQNIADLYTPYHPALLRLIKTVIDHGHDAGIWVGMCGEVAGNEKLLPLLIALGLDEFSMSPSMVLKSRALISKMNKSELVQHIEEIMNVPDSYDVLRILEQKFATPNL